MYGSVYSSNSQSSVQYSIFNDNSNESIPHEITFVENSNESEDSPVFKSSLKPTAVAGRKISTISIISTTLSEKERTVPEIEFESQKRSAVVQENFLKTKKFLQLYKLRTYLSFLENLVPKMDQVKEKIEEFCDHQEDNECKDNAEEIFEFSSKIDEEIEGISKDFGQFDETKSKLLSHLEILKKELNSVENLMTTAFAAQLYDKEFLQIETHLRKLYLPGSALTEPAHFDRCLGFILDSPIMKNSRLKSMAFEALVATMENTGNLFKPNSEIVRLAYHVKSFEKEIEDSELRKIFSDAVQTIIWKPAVHIYLSDEQITENGQKSFLQASDQIPGYIRLSPENQGDENRWSFVPIPETRGHYFYLKNLKTETLLGLKRDGPEYRQIHHRPLQFGYFNQHWQVQVDHQDKIVLKNRAHFDLVLTSNAASNVLPNSFHYLPVQCWSIEETDLVD